MERGTVKDTECVEFIQMTRGDDQREDANISAMISEYSNFTNIKQEVKGNM